MTIRGAAATTVLVAAIGSLAMPGAAWAQQQNPQERAEELAQEGLDRLMLALEAMLEAIPQYELPEILENGDIIIRRVRPNGDLDDPDSDMDET